MSEPWVVSTVCVRRRPWAAPFWVGAMAAQTRRPDAVLVVVDEAESGDGTRESWWTAARDCGACFGVRLAIDSLSSPSAPGWSRQADAEGRRYSDDAHAHLARLRNWTVERALELWPQATAIWCCDSDVAPEPDVLELLLAADKPVVGARVRNSERAWNFMSGHNGTEPYRAGWEVNELSRTPPLPVSLVGACCLYSREALDRGLRWGPHKNGEDCALAIQARELGVSLWIEPRARCAHFMNGPDQEPLR